VIILFGEAQSPYVTNLGTPTGFYNRPSLGKPKFPAGCGSTVLDAAEPLEDEAVANDRA